MKTDCLDLQSFCNGLVFFSPVALLVRTTAGVSLSRFFLLQVVLSLVIFLSEIPAGRLTDRIGLKHTLVLYQVALCCARILLFVAFMARSFVLFVVEAIVEGIACSLSSGTQSAYIYEMFPDGQYVIKSAHNAKYGTAGFIISTVCYAGIYYLSGIPGLLIATIATSALGIPAALGIRQEPMKKVEDTAADRLDISDIKVLLNVRTVLVIVLLSVISIGFILINFFYVDKLLACHVDEKWLTVIILAYSSIELSAQKIMEKIPQKNYLFFFSLFFVLAGVCIGIFGFANRLPVVLVLMLVLPLLLDLPSYLLGDIQNALVDRYHRQEHRAGLLSVFNMGVNLVEIAYLLCSSVLSVSGAALCFGVLGLLMVGLGMLSGRLLTGDFSGIPDNNTT